MNLFTPGALASARMQAARRMDKARFITLSETKVETPLGTSKSWAEDGEPYAGSIEAADVDLVSTELLRDGKMVYRLTVLSGAPVALAGRVRDLAETVDYKVVSVVADKSKIVSMYLVTRV